MAEGLWEVFLYGVALALVIWILVPAAAFALGGMRLRSEVRLEPALAEPKGDDPDYARRFGQFAALGFRALGFSEESCWFMMPTKWYWRSFQGLRWMVAPDEKTLISFHRLSADEPVRYGATTVFDDGGLVRTACPGAGLTFQDGNYLRMELRGVEPAELLSKHEIHAMAFSMDGDRKVKKATLEEVTRIEVAQDAKMLKRAGSYSPLLRYFALPAIAGFLATGSSRAFHRLAFAIWVGAAVFAVFRFVIAPRERRRRIIASHTVDKTDAGDMRARNERAKELLQQKRYDEATEEFAWLWENIERIEPGMGGVRVSFMAGEIERLVAEHAPARPRFEAIRDRAAAAADGSPTATGPRIDWAVLNKVLGDDDRTITWFDKVKNDPAAASVVGHLAILLEPLLKTRGRWADIGGLVRDPMAKLEFHHSVLRSTELPMMRQRIGADAFAHMRAAQEKLFRSGVADLVASLRAAGRNDDAMAVRDKAIVLDPSDEMKQALEHSPVPGPALN